MDFAHITTVLQFTGQQENRCAWIEQNLEREMVCRCPLILFNIQRNVFEVPEDLIFCANIDGILRCYVLRPESFVLLPLLN